MTDSPTDTPRHRNIDPNGDPSSGTKSHHVSALSHVMTRYKVKVFRRKQQMPVFSFFDLSIHLTATQPNGIITSKIRKRQKARKHYIIGTVSFRLSARENAPESASHAFDASIFLLL